MHAYILFINYHKSNGVEGKGYMGIKTKENILALEFDTVRFLNRVEAFIEQKLGYSTVVTTNIYYKGYGRKEDVQGFEVAL